jgi:drug/metabolite transporter (DMT)-like permease
VGNPAPPAAARDHVVMLAVVTVLWGLNWPALKAALIAFEPWAFRAAVLVVASLTLFAIGRALGHRCRLPRQLWRAMAVPALMVTGWHVFSAFGVSQLGGGRAAIIAFTMPLWAALLSIWWLGERPEPRRIGALGLGLLGLLLLLVGDVGRLQAAPWGALLMLAAALSWAIGTVATKATAWGLSAIVLTAWQLALGAVPIVAVALVRDAPTGFADAGPLAWTGALYSTFVAMVVCFCAHIRLVTLLPATVAAIGVMAIPVVGLFGSAILLGEPVGPLELAALALVVGGQAVLFLAPRRARA